MAREEEMREEETREDAAREEETREEETREEETREVARGIIFLFVYTTISLSRFSCIDIVLGVRSR